MDDDRGGTLEAALAATEADAQGAVAASKALARALGAALRSSRSGDLRALQRALAGAEEALADVAEAVGQLREGWSLEEQDLVELLASGRYAAELLAEAKGAGLAIYEQDDVLASYPSLVRLLPRQQAVSIDRKPHRQIRPGALVQHLLGLQRREPSLGVERFAETLHAAYRLLASEPGVMVPLAEVHRALTLLPASARDYGRQEFARDVYLLDRSGHTVVKSGARLRLSAGATSARDRRNLLLVVTREGVEKSYFGIEFLDGPA